MVTTFTAIGSRCRSEVDVIERRPASHGTHSYSLRAIPELPSGERVEHRAKGFVNKSDSACMCYRPLDD